MTLQEVYNVFCPTGEGGGIDPSCGQNGSVTKALFKDSVERGHTGFENALVYETGDVIDIASQYEERLTAMGYKKFAELSLPDDENPAVTDSAELNFRLAPGKELNMYIRGNGSKTVVLFDETPMDKGGALHDTPYTMPAAIKKIRDYIL